MKAVQYKLRSTSTLAKLLIFELIESMFMLFVIPKIKKNTQKKN